MRNVECTNCERTDAVGVYEDGDFCHRCKIVFNPKRLTLNSSSRKKRINQEITLYPINDSWREWLKKRYLTDKTIDFFEVSVGYTGKKLIYPIKCEKEIIGVQLRDTKKHIKTIKYIEDDQPFLFGATRLSYPFTAILVEDPISAMRIWQDTGITAYALMGTNLSDINKNFIISNYNRILVWLDGDIWGYKAARDITNSLQNFRETRLIFTQHDPKDLQPNEIKWIIETTLSQDAITNE